MKKIINYSLAIIMTLILGMVSVKAAFPNSFTSGASARPWSSGTDFFYAWPVGDTCATNYESDPSGCPNGENGRHLSYLVDSSNNPVLCLDYKTRYGNGVTYTKEDVQTNTGYACAVLNVWKNDGYTPKGGTHSKINATLGTITVTTNLTENQYKAIQMAMWDYVANTSSWPLPSSCESYRTKTAATGVQHVMTITEAGNGKLKLNDAETYYVSSAISVNLVGYTDYANGVKFRVKVTGAPANSYISATPAGTALTVTDGYYQYTATDSTPKIYLNIPVTEESYDIGNIVVTVYAQYKSYKVTTATASVARYSHSGNQDAALIELTTTDDYTYTEESQPVTFRIEPKKVSISKKDIANENEIENAHIVIAKETTGEPVMVEEFDSTTTPHEVYLSSGIYTLTETLAPDGYQRVETVFRFEVSSTGKVTLLSTQSNMFSANGSDITVYNKLYTVPSTGSSMSITYFLIGGVLLIAGGLMVYLMLRKRNAEGI